MRNDFWLIVIAYSIKSPLKLEFILYYIILYNTLLNSDCLIGCLWSRSID
jgi:hypothetical protein